MSNATLEHIHQVLVNIVRAFKSQHTYIDKNGLFTGILAAAAFAFLSTTNRQKCYSPGQLIFGRDMILPIKHRVDWDLIHHQKQTQINRDNAHEKIYRFEYEYKVGDKVMLNNHTAYKHETPYKSPFVIKQCFINGTLMLQYGATEIMYNIRRIK